jgi:hypothetical protein
MFNSAVADAIDRDELWIGEEGGGIGDIVAGDGNENLESESNG